MSISSEQLSEMSAAALPAAVLSSITACAEACRTTLTRLENERDRLRTALARRIHQAPDLSLIHI